MTTNAGRFFFDRDQSGHWYLVPWEIRDAWREWKEIPEDDERSWTPPEDAVRLQYPINSYSFTDPDQD